MVDGQPGTSHSNEVGMDLRGSHNGSRSILHCLVILMLGTNDFQFCHPYNDAWSAAQGIATLISEIRKASIEPGMPVPPVLVICPPQIRSPRGNIAPKFRGAEQRCVGLAEAYMQVASDLGCHFFNAETVTTSSRVDGVHLES